MSSTALNHFGLKLVADIAANDRHKNLFVSPLSLFLALSMTESGAEGESRKAMRQTLAVPADVSEEALHQSASDLMKSLQAQKGIELNIANALWADKSFPFAPDFITRTHTFYQADATTLDFQNAKATADAINTWVKKKTQEKIPGIVTEQDVKSSRAVLTNAVFFRGRWEHPFSEPQTQDAPFHRQDGGEKQVPMMRRTDLKRAYRSGQGYEAAALPYRDSDVELYAILPAHGRSPEDVLAALSVAALLSSAEPSELDLTLPRFSVEFGPTNLKTTLVHMGMAPAFEDRHEFVPMGSPKFYINAVLHRTRLEVDEAGTVATAASAVMMAPMGAAPQPLPRKTLVFDRPFAVVMCDTQTGAILFAGVIYDPGK